MRNLIDSYDQNKKLIGSKKLISDWFRNVNFDPIFKFSSFH